MNSVVSAVSVKNVTVMYQDTVALHSVSVEVPVGSLLAIIGPNGAGKTTFMKSILGLLQPIAGTISIFGSTLNQQRNKVAYVPQRMSVDWDFPINVYDVVMMGRYGKLGWLRRPGAEDKRCVLEALEQVDLQAHAYKPIGQLSGGQQQRVFFARALAQQAELYLLDEPFVNIDGATEHTLVCILQELTRHGKTVLVVHHDLHTVRAYFESALLLNVQVLAQGSVDQIITPACLQRAYGGRYSGPAQEKDSLVWR
ncbi:MAG: ABC transporter ATP-binding protein [Candidatus Dependentiae bacterium]|nr:ABC transporter ATP-binding protein [Candidatus Dependentiae bacterium]